MNRYPTGSSGAGLTPGYRYRRNHTDYLMVPCLRCSRWRVEIVEWPGAVHAPKAGRRFWVGTLTGAPIVGCACIHDRHPVIVLGTTWDARWSNGWRMALSRDYVELIHPRSPA